MKSSVLRMSLAVGLVFVLGTAGVVAAEASGSKVQKQIQIAKLSKKTVKVLRRAGVVGPTLDLAGTPVAQTSLYHAPWAKGGQCISAVTAGVVDGADCDPSMFTSRMPGYASAGALGFTPSGQPVAGQLPKGTIQILQVYGVATSVVRSARLIGPKSGTTELPLSAGATGFVAFGSSNPPGDGNFVELLNAAGKVVQKIQIAP